MNSEMTKPTKLSVHPASTQSNQSSLSAWRKLGPLATHWAYSEDSDQTWPMPRLIWFFAWRTCHFVGFVMLNHEKRNLSIVRFEVLQLHMHSNFKGEDIWLSVWSFPYVPILSERTAIALAWLRGCADSPEPSLFVYVPFSLTLAQMLILGVLWRKKNTKTLEVQFWAC